MGFATKVLFAIVVVNLAANVKTTLIFPLGIQFPLDKCNDQCGQCPNLAGKPVASCQRGCKYGTISNMLPGSYVDNAGYKRCIQGCQFKFIAEAVDDYRDCENGCKFLDKIVKNPQSSPYTSSLMMTIIPDKNAKPFSNYVNIQDISDYLADPVHKDEMLLNYFLGVQVPDNLFDQIATVIGNDQNIHEEIKKPVAVRNRGDEMERISNITQNTSTLFVDDTSKPKISESLTNKNNSIDNDGNNNNKDNTVITETGESQEKQIVEKVKLIVIKRTQEVYYSESRTYSKIYRTDYEIDLRDTDDQDLPTIEIVLEEDDRISFPRMKSANIENKGRFMDHETLVHMIHHDTDFKELNQNKQDPMEMEKPVNGIDKEKPYKCEVAIKDLFPSWFKVNYRIVFTVLFFIAATLSVYKVIRCNEDFHRSKRFGAMSPIDLNKNAPIVMVVDKDRSIKLNNSGPENITYSKERFGDPLISKHS